MIPATPWLYSCHRASLACLTTVLVVAGGANVRAECAGVRSACEELRAADVVFYGEVVISRWAEHGGTDDDVVFRVIRAFKGVDATRFAGTFSLSAESLYFAPGTKVLVYARRHNGRWSTNCTRSAFPLRDVADEIKQLDACARAKAAVTDDGSTSGTLEDLDTDALVQRLRGLPQYIGGIARSDGRLRPAEQRREAVYGELRRRPDAVAALARGLAGPDPSLRRDVVVALTTFGLSTHSPTKAAVDLRPAVPALVDALDDPDSFVQSGAAQVLAAVGPDAARAVPALIKLLESDEEGVRNSACIALRGIGPSAKAALPALRRALADPNRDVQRFARAAIERIQGSK